MANEIENSLFTAIDTIVGRRIDQLELDKTVVASIEQCTSASEKQYRVQYKGGSMFAYAQADDTYSPNTSVYVSIPQNDFSQKKWILGRVTSMYGDSAISEVSSALADYQLVGDNVVTHVADKICGVNSWKYEKDKQIHVIKLYDRLATTSENYISIDQEKFKTYAQESTALLLEASFRTELNRSHQNETQAEYGLIFDCVFDNSNNTYNSNKAYLEALWTNIKGEITEGEETKTVSLQEIDEVVRAEVENFSSFFDKFATNIAEVITRCSARIEALEKLFIGNEKVKEAELLSNYKELLNEMLADLMHKDDNGDSSPVFTWNKRYLEWLEETPKSLLPKEVSYSLYSDNMIGNPLKFFNSTEQYDIFPFDGKRFLYVNQVLFYCRDFNGSMGGTDVTGCDIFVDEIELYGLEELSSTNGDYRLKMEFPQGQIFKMPATNEENPSLKIKASLTHKNVELTSGVEYYWFVKDGNVKTANDLRYHFRGGVGWRYFLFNEQNPVTDKDNLTISSNANSAYENIYKCVVVYEDTIILKSEFKIYNPLNHREIVVESNLSKSFKFDSGTPTFTCKILDNIMADQETEPISVETTYTDIEDDVETVYEYSYSWMRQTQSNETTVIEDYNIVKDRYDTATDSEKLILKSALTESEGVVAKNNQLTYPISRIASNEFATFDCYVYRKKQGDEDWLYLGVGSITVRNDLTPSAPDYNIIIENGDQVFKYNEAGVSPCVDRIQDPQEIHNLACHFYDMNGNEVNSDLYKVTWKYPLDSTLIIAPENLQENPANGLQQLSRERTVSFTIQDEYDYSCLNNQIICLVEYNDITVEKPTSFYFGKVGDNGTNGTDVVAKISPWDNGNVLKRDGMEEPLTLITTPTGAKWNSGLEFSEGTTPLEFILYRKAEKIDASEYINMKWTMAGGATKSNRFSAKANVSPNFASISKGTGKCSNQIIKAEAKLAKVDGSNETQTHYAFYPIPVIDYDNEWYAQNIRINKRKTLSHILYNADGRNPLYNENQGVFFNFSEQEDTPYTVSWEAKGGLTDLENEPAFDLYYDKDIPDSKIAAGELKRTLDNCPYVYIKPKDVYGGAAQNNHIKATIYTSSITDGQNSRIKVATVYIPIYISLNLYGLASLNAWDGNTIEINEDNNYIMAPQIGAGVKNNDNTFTGIVMGKATTYDMKKEQVGLLGYSSGRQSIFLDAATGNATFGLPEQDERDPNQKNLSEGRIELRPGGLSSIANWKFNSRMLFNVTDAEQTEDYETWGGLKDCYADLDKNKYLKSIPHDKSGILLNSDPSYISIKGKTLAADDKDIDFSQAGTIVKPGDSFELQFNPNDNSIFTIYRHTKATSNAYVGVVIDKNDEYKTPYIKDISKEQNEDVDAAPNETAITYSEPEGYYDSEKEKFIVTGWNAINEYGEGDNLCYFIAYPYEQNNKTVWVIKEVPAPGFYSLDNFEDIGAWRREKRVGINQQGRFYTNALKSSSSALNIDSVGAFGLKADVSPYVGASFEVGATDDESRSLIKMFMNGGAEGEYLSEANRTLYISGGSDDDNEYARPIKIYGEEVRLYSDDEKNTNTHSLHEIAVTSDYAYIGTSNSENINNRDAGNYLLLKNEDSSSLLSKNSFNTIIGEVQNEEQTDSDGNILWPWLFKEKEFAIPSSGNDNTNNAVRVYNGSIANYAFNPSRQSNIAEEQSTGHILNYAVGSLQLNRAQESKQEDVDENGETVTTYSYGVDKALQINENNILLGHLNIFEEDLDEEWGTADFGLRNLCTDILEEKSAFEMTKDRTSLISAPRIGIYGQNDIEVKALKHSDVVGGSISLIADCNNIVLREDGTIEDINTASGLYLTPNSGGTNTSKASGAFRLYSQYGSLYSREDALSGYTKDGYPTNGIIASAPMNIPCLIVDSTVEGMVEGEKRPLLGIYSWGRIYCDSEIYTDTNLRVNQNAYINGNVVAYEVLYDQEYEIGGYRSNSIYYHLENLSYRISNLSAKITEIEKNMPTTNGLASESWVTDTFLAKSTYDNHAHKFTYNSSGGSVSAIYSSGGSYETRTQSPMQL